MNVFRKISAALVSAMVAVMAGGYAAFAQTTTQITEYNCRQCAKICSTTLNYCNRQGGRFNSDSVTNALKDAIAACKAAEGFIARSSKYEAKYASICADACNRCAKTCESFKEDTTMRACADECRKCGGNCTKVASGQPGL